MSEMGHSRQGLTSGRSRMVRHAAESGRGAVRSTQCPLYPDGDQTLQRKEMTRWANSRHRMLV
jgi:hypothetical protein